MTQTQRFTWRRQAGIAEPSGRGGSVLLPVEIGAMTTPSRAEPPRQLRAATNGRRPKSGVIEIELARRVAYASTTKSVPMRFHTREALARSDRRLQPDAPALCDRLSDPNRLRTNLHRNGRSASQPDQLRRSSVAPSALRRQSQPRLWLQMDERRRSQQGQEYSRSFAQTRFAHFLGAYQSHKCLFVADRAGRSKAI